jgi:hypothetical protein
MITLRRSACPLLAVATWGAAVQASAAPAGLVADAAIERLQPGWQVMHCGVSRGVLYVTYVDQGKAAIAPAFATPAILKACAETGHPVGASAPARAPMTPMTPMTPIHPRGSGSLAVPNPQPPARTRVEPTFVAQASGSVVEISGRNDGDAAYHCVISFSWTFDDDPSGPRSVTTQATLPGRQLNRVVFISGPYRNVRFVGPPTWHCMASE